MDRIINIKEGMSDELIAKLTGLTEYQVNIIRKSITNYVRVKGYLKRYPFSIKKGYHLPLIRRTVP